MKPTKVHAMAILCLIAASSQAQPLIETKVGMSTRFGPAVTIDAGTMIRPGYNYSGILAAATATMEAGFGASYGAYIGAQSYGLSIIAGAALWQPMNTKLENNKPFYPIIGIGYRYPENRFVVDARYVGNSIILSMGYRFGKGHNE